MARVFEECAAAFGYRNLCRPWRGKCLRIINRKLIEKGTGIDTPKSLCDPQALAGSAECRSVREICCFHDQRVSVPMGAGIAFQLADVLWKMRTLIQWNDAHIMDHLDENRHIPG